jgi:phosphotransferase system enzyme I (PtsI)
VCGEAASDPSLAVVLVGLGVSSLSMTPRSIAAVAEVLRRTTLEQCRTAAAQAVAAPSAADARRAVRDSLAETLDALGL